jgi:hypothetical protein
MKKVILKTSAVLAALIGLVLLPTLLYNLCWLAGMQDCADGPRWISALIIVGIVGLFVLSYWLFQRVAREPENLCAAPTQFAVAVGTTIADRPPHGSARALISACGSYRR